MTSADRTLLPLETLRACARRYPHAWDTYAGFRADRKALGGWPDHVYCPLSGAYAIVSGGSNKIPERMIDVGLLGALAAWRPTLGIYRFDETLLDALWTTPIDGQIPVEHLYRLPEWCVYVELPGRVTLGNRIAGAWVHLEHDASDGRSELRVVLLSEDGKDVAPLPIHLRGGTLDRAIDLMIDEADAQRALLQGPVAGLPRVAGDIAREIAPVISVVLYLCSEEPEMRDALGSDRRPTRPVERVDKQGRPRIYGAQGPTRWEAGYRIGAALRRAQESASRASDGASGRSVTPHVRRAHWHTYVLGPRADASRQTRSLRWLPPIPIGLEEGEGPLPVVRPVR